MQEQEELSGEVLLLSHNGLGDNITMIGAINYLLTCYKRVYFICKDTNEKNLRLLLDDRVILQPFDASNELTYVYRVILEAPPERDILISGNFYTRFKVLSTRITNQKLKSRVKSDKNYSIKYNFIRDFYHVINLDLSVYYDYFDISGNQDTEYYYNLIKNYKIIFMHTKASNSEIKLNNIINKYRYEKNYILVCSNKNFYKSYEDKYELANKLVNLPVYHYIDIIKNADEIHVIDSCFCCIVYPMFYREDKILKAHLFKIYDRPENINTSNISTRNTRNIYYLLGYHRSLDYEITNLIKNGYGCYIRDNREYDNFLQIKPKYINYLNKNIIDSKSIKILNRYFLNIFVDLTISPEIYHLLTKEYTGSIYFRINSCNILTSLTGYKLSTKTYFIFSNKKLYDNENKISDNYFVNKSLVYKTGFTNKLYSSLTDKYKYTKSKKIGYLYQDQEVIKYFENYNLELINLDNLDLDQISCIYYNNNNIYTVDYFILELLITNTPIIFHHESYIANILEDSPGLSDNIQDARNIIDRIISGDLNLIYNIIEIQKKAVHELLSDEMIVSL